MYTASVPTLIGNTGREVYIGIGDIGDIGIVLLLVILVLLILLVLFIPFSLIYSSLIYSVLSV